MGLGPSSNLLIFAKDLTEPQTLFCVGLGFPNSDFKVHITRPCPAKASFNFMLGFCKCKSWCKTELFSLCISALPMRLMVLEEGKVSYSYCSTPSSGVVCAVVLQHCESWKEQLHFWFTVIQSSWGFIKSCESGPGNDVLIIFS